MPVSDGGLGGLGESPTHGAMLHFGPDVASKAIAKAATSDGDLLKLMPTGTMSKKPKKKPKVCQPVPVVSLLRQLHRLGHKLLCLPSYSTAILSCGQDSPNSICCVVSARTRTRGLLRVC